MLFRYKPEEGRNARQIAFWGGEAVLFFGCMALRGTLDGIGSLQQSLFSGFPAVPILGWRLSPSLLITVAVFLLGSYLLIRKLAAQKAAQHLIEVESEINKVTWPSFKEASNSSVVVISTVIVLMGFLALADFLLGTFFRSILWAD